MCFLEALRQVFVITALRILSPRDSRGGGMCKHIASMHVVLHCTLFRTTSWHGLTAGVSDSNPARLKTARGGWRGHSPPRLPRRQCQSCMCWTATALMAHCLKQRCWVGVARSFCKTDLLAATATVVSSMYVYMCFHTQASLQAQ